MRLWERPQSWTNTIKLKKKEKHKVLVFNLHGRRNVSLARKRVSHLP